MPKGIYPRRENTASKVLALISDIPKETKHWSETPCIEWPGALDIGGYAKGWFVDRQMPLSRVAFFFFYGNFPEKLACHHCDNRKCINPLHIFDGSHQQNMDDGRLKGRFPKGAASAGARRARIDPSIVFSLNEQGMSIKGIAERLSISRPYVQRILRKERRHHVS